MDERFLEVITRPLQESSASGPRAFTEASTKILRSLGIVFGASGGFVQSLPGNWESIYWLGRVAFLGVLIRMGFGQKADICLEKED